jgi:hypothetical protein
LLFLDNIDVFFLAFFNDARIYVQFGMFSPPTVRNFFFFLRAIQNRYQRSPRDPHVSFGGVFVFISTAVAATIVDFDFVFVRLPSLLVVLCGG